MAKSVIFILGVLGLCWQVSGKNKYDNYTLLKITPNNMRQLNALRKLSAISSGEVDVLKSSRGLHDTTDILVSPRKRATVGRLAARHKMPIKFTNHYGRVFNREAKHLKTLKLTSSDRFNLFEYNSYDAMSKHLHNLAKKNRKLITLQTLGKSYEGREMRLVKISTDPGARNPVIFIDAGAHAREWAAPALAIYLIERLANGPHQLDGVDWYILPLTNPDGYEYSRKDQSNRLWRKTRSKTIKEGCLGVDINRNYGFKWGVIDVSFDPCDFQTYAGPKPFSEPESRMVRDVMKMYSDRIKLYVSIHTYGQYLVYPWGYTEKELPPTSTKLHELARLFSKSVENAGGKPFNIMSAGEWYPSAGGSDDYAFGAVKIPYVYTLEITDDYEFTFPTNLLASALPQYYEGFKIFASEIKKEFRKNNPKGIQVTKYDGSNPNTHQESMHSSQCDLANR